MMKNLEVMIKNLVLNEGKATVMNSLELSEYKPHSFEFELFRQSEDNTIHFEIKFEVSCVSLIKTNKYLLMGYVTEYGYIGIHRVFDYNDKSLLMVYGSKYIESENNIFKNTGKEVK